MYADVLIIGAGVVGLSTAKALLESNSNLKLVIVDKEFSLGKHASGRNSGVLHSGFYYSPNSLKAKFCFDGNLALRKLCLEHGIPVKTLGKVVVTKSLQEVGRLESLFTRGKENGVELELLPESALKKFEPLARTYQSFIWSPNTAVSDPRKVLLTLSSLVKGMNGQIILGATIKLGVDSQTITLNGETLIARHVINTAGSGADRIAHRFGFGINFSMIPFMGIYRAVTHSRLPLSTLVYPVPDPVNPFLGVHLTSTIDGKVKIGPTAIPLLNREQYRIFAGWNLIDIKESLTGLLCMLRGDAHNLPGLAKSEFPKLFLTRLIRDAAELVPATGKVKGWEKLQPGIRSQLVDLTTGSLVNDFIVEGDGLSTHVLNVVSPGWTASIPFGKYIAEQVLNKI